MSRMATTLSGHTIFVIGFVSGVLVEHGRIRVALSCHAAVRACCSALVESGFRWQLPERAREQLHDRSCVGTYRCRAGRRARSESRLSAGSRILGARHCRSGAGRSPFKGLHTCSVSKTRGGTRHKVVDVHGHADQVVLSLGVRQLRCPTGCKFDMTWFMKQAEIGSIHKLLARQRLEREAWGADQVIQLELHGNADSRKQSKIALDKGLYGPVFVFQATEL